MTTELSFDGRFQGILMEVLERESGPHPVWTDSPAAQRIADPRRRRHASHWPIRLLAVAAVLTIGGAVIGGALLRDRTEPPRPRVANGWIAFAASQALPNGDSDPYSGNDIYVIREGQPPRRIVGSDTDLLDHVCPAFSPDGTRLAYGQGPLGGRNGIRTVELVIADLGPDGTVSGSYQVPVGLSLQPPCPTWSPDGRHVAFTVPMAHLFDFSLPARGSAVWIVSVDDGRIDVLPDLLPSDLEWSPDGTELAIASGFDTLTRRTQPRDTALQMYTASTGELRTVGPSGVDRMTWSPDGTRIAYQRGSMPGQIELWVANRDGSGARMLDRGFDVNHGIGPVWSPDGDRIVYQRVTVGGRESHEVVVVSPDAASEVVVPLVVQRPGAETIDMSPVRVTWSPDGKSLLAVGWGDGITGEAIIVVPIDSTSPPRLLHESPTVSAYDTDVILPIQSWGRQPDR